MRNFLAFLLLVLIGILGRTVFHMGPNVELVTMGAILAGFYLGRFWGVLTALVIMVITDKMIGNTNIYIFTWSGYVFIGLFGGELVRRIGNSKIFKRLSKGISRIVGGAGIGVVASLFFYLWTNFGVWFLDSWGMYDRNLAGLVKCYVMGLPFLRFNLLGNLVFVPLSFFMVEYAGCWFLKAACSFRLSRKTEMLDS